MDFCETIEWMGYMFQFHWYLCIYQVKILQLIVCSIIIVLTIKHVYTYIHRHWGKETHVLCSINYIVNMPINLHIVNDNCNSRITIFINYNDREIYWHVLQLIFNIFIFHKISFDYALSIILSQLLPYPSPVLLCYFLWQKQI